MKHGVHLIDQSDSVVSPHAQDAARKVEFAASLPEELSIFCKRVGSRRFQERRVYFQERGELQLRLKAVDICVDTQTCELQRKATRNAPADSHLRKKDFTAPGVVHTMPPFCFAERSRLSSLLRPFKLS